MSSTISSSVTSGANTGNRSGASVRALVAESVTQTMHAKGLTQLSLSEHTGIPRTTLLRRLNGHSAFTVDELAAIGQHLGVDPITFMPVGLGGDAA